MKKLDFDSDEGEDSLTINKKFAKKFEFNKSREEFQKLSSKYGSDDSDSEEEDETGELATAEIEQGITQVLNTIRNNPEKLKDKDLKFFPEIDDQNQAAGGLVAKKEKPLTLKEYVLTQNNDEDEQPETFVQQQTRHKKELIDEINAHDENESGDDDDDFLTKRKEEREVEPVTLPDPDKDAQGFLDAFVSNKGWLDGRAYAQGGEVPSYKQVVGESDDEEFDDIAEKYESSYNFRFEDPSSAEIMSYARDQNTLRRKQDSSRQKQRDKKRAQREEEESSRKKDMARLRKLKVQQVTDRLQQIKDVLGNDMITAEDLEGDWDDNEWDKRMQKLFNDDFYQGDDDFKPSGVEDLEKEFGTDPGAGKGVEAEDSEGDDEGNAEVEPQPQAEPKQSKNLAKMSKKDLKRKAQEFVDANNDLLAEEVYAPAATFKYRTVEPESFGLSAQDILLADDRQLNMYVGLKKLGSFRDQEKVAKDKKRYGKKRRLRQWRQEVWGNEEGPGTDAWEKLKQESLPQTKHKKHKKQKQRR